ncbi:MULTISPECIES: hypothetical protein [unclassified Arcicella]|uniref:hypothetical protein n=1 Tax=unclassified Arcicella TaxID=2644986 RepID=UPI0028626322|nr:MULTISPECIES: hypothetical protein [unclassified Arcicella]MDR6564483.1 hypothetical protein [Arcicella sp. BE51]MDR6814342.1 hypothetical protein [Arcicella sp. BE140]MDR6825636.1 hypothetical protein [Arcicella sp. BE139]
MKTFVKSFAIAVLSVMSFVASATNTNEPANTKKSFAVGMYQTINTMKMNVLIEKSTNKNLYISLKNEKGDVLHKEKVGKANEKYHGKFDLSELQDGKYSFEITDGESKIVKTVNIGTKTPEPTSQDRFISLN